VGAGRDRAEEIRRFIVERVSRHPRDVARLVAEQFGLSRQAANQHLRRLVEEGVLAADGLTRQRSYRLVTLASWARSYERTADLAEDVVWRLDVRPVLGELPKNVVDIWQYGVTEMFNNAIEHSGGGAIRVEVRRDAAVTEITLSDDGVGVFRKITTALGLLDERHAVLELAKGKLTTDPVNHTGEGIFFSSRMFDEFTIRSGGVIFLHRFGEPEDWIAESQEAVTGTTVVMRLGNHTARTASQLFDKYTSGDDFGFNRTVVPVALARYGDDNLVSRSQARRLLARVDRFRTVILDFRGVEEIGQAFADEIFRVYAKRHPEIELRSINAGPNVSRMIARATVRNG